MPEILGDLRHPLHRFALKRAKGGAMAAMAAIGGLLRKLLVMQCGDAIPAQGQIVVFVYQSDVESEGAGGAVMAIDAAA